MSSFEVFFSMIVVKMVARAHEELTEWVRESSSDVVCVERRRRLFPDWLHAAGW